MLEKLFESSPAIAAIILIVIIFLRFLAVWNNKNSENIRAITSDCKATIKGLTSDHREAIAMITREQRESNERAAREQREAMEGCHGIQKIFAAQLQENTRALSRVKFGRPNRHQGADTEYSD